MALEFRVLGPLEMRRHGVAVPVRGRNLRALLAALLIDAGRVVSADALTEVLWPTRPPNDARHALEASVSRLRQSVGEEAPVQARAPGYVLSVEPGTIDAVRFRRLLAEANDLLDADPRRASAGIDAALALWRGTPYAEFTFDEFAREEIAELTELRLQAEEKEIEAALATGRAEDVLGKIAALVAAEPTRERRREQLMLALYRAGRQADALTAFREARKIFADELGLEPGERLRDLERAILRQDPLLAPQPQPQRSRAAARTRRPATALVVEPDIPLDLDAEEHERRTQRAATRVDRVAEHYGARRIEPFALVFVGEDHRAAAAGAARDLAEELPARTGVASGDAVLHDGGLGGPLVELARRNVGQDLPAPSAVRREDGPFVGRADELDLLRTARATLIVGPPGIGKSRLVRELARETRVAVGRCSAYAQEALEPLREIASALGHADALDGLPASDVPYVFRRLCERAAPVTVAVDDLQWASPIVLEVLEHLVERSDELVRIVAVARDEPLEEGLAGLVTAQLSLAPLPSHDAAALANALGARDVSLAERAEGNPLFIEQLIAHADETDAVLPATLHALLASRLDRLTPTERATVDCGAVAGREFDAALVGTMLQTAGPRGTLHSLVARGLLDPAPATAAFEERFRFRHPLIHEAAYASVPRDRRTRLHESVADALTDRGADDELIGFHLERAAVLRPDGDRHGRRLSEEGGERLGAAGVAAWKRGDAHTTARLLERAVALLPPPHARRGELLCELATALNTLGRVGDADIALEAAGASEDRRIRLRANLERAALGAVAGAVTADDVLAAANAAIPVFEAVEDSRSLGRAFMLAGWVRGGAQAQHSQWQAAAERALDLYRRAGWRASTCIGHIAAALYHGPVPAPLAIERCEALLADTVDDLAAEAAVSAHLGGLRAMVGDGACARDALERSRSVYEGLGRMPSLRRTCCPIEAAAARLEGDTERSAWLLEASCKDLASAGDTFHLATQAAELADALVDLGRIDEAELWCGLAEQHRQARDIEGSVLVLRSRARLTSDAALAEQAARLAAGTDALNLRASVNATVAEITSDPTALAMARELYARKGNAAAVARLGGRPSAAAP